MQLYNVCLSLFRLELNELKLVHDQCGEYAKEQSTLIQNLQSLQDQTQTGIRESVEVTPKMCDLNFGLLFVEYTPQ